MSFRGARERTVGQSRHKSAISASQIYWVANAGSSSADPYPPSVAKAMPRRLNKQTWARLRRAFVFGHSLGAISEATGVSRGTLSAYAKRHQWSRISGTEILRKQLERTNEK